ncbi:hypothetical protein ACJBV4_10330, partial [Streptococcus suis]
MKYTSKKEIYLSKTAKTKKNYISSGHRFFFFLVIQCERKVIKVNIEQLLFALNPKVEIIMR